jgi:hypothetical protein
MSQLAVLWMSLIRHSGLDPWFDRPFDRLTVMSKVEGLTTLSNVEGESSFFSTCYTAGCRSQIPSLAGIKSGMTSRV